MWQWLSDLLTGRTRPQREGQEPDVDPDPAQVDTHDTFVGRAAGDDVGYAGETGAEARAERDS